MIFWGFMLEWCQGGVKTLSLCPGVLVFSWGLTGDLPGLQVEQAFSGVNLECNPKCAWEFIGANCRRCLVQVTTTFLALHHVYQACPGAWPYWCVPGVPGMPHNQCGHKCGRG